MKQISISTLKIGIYIFLFTSLGCTDRKELESDIPAFTCDDDSLFQLEEMNGTMLFMPCYGSWAIRPDSTDVVSQYVTGASLDIPQAFHEEGLKVTFSACYYEFDLPLLIPDPSPWGELYVIKDYDIEVR